MLEGESKVINRPRVSKGKKYDSLFIYIPADLTKDSQFPFKSGDRVSIKVVENQLVIEKAKKP